MKNPLKKYILPVAACSMALTGCLQEYTPTDLATDSQLQGADKAGISNAVGAYMTTFGTEDAYDVGFPGFGLWRDAMTADFSIVDQSWDYFNFFNTQTYLGNYQLQQTFWDRYYALIQKANNVLSVCDLSSADDAPYAGNALVYRAAAYLDLQRMYEYRLTGVGYLDQAAESRGILGTTVPIVTENTTEAEGRNNPRAPFWQLYRFILTDLTNAEACLSNCPAPESKTNAGLGACYGQLARTWLEIATRFEHHNEDMAQALQREDDPALSALVPLGVASATEAYSRAARYARMAIAQGYTPLAEGQWFDPVTGFNSPNQAWMWCVTIAPSDEAASWAVWQSFVSFTSPEANYGLASITYSGGRTIDARLFGSIDPADWRRTTWIAPGDQGNRQAYTARYAKGTSMDYAEWSQYAPYVGFKFHPGSGDRNTSAVGNAVSIPLMRVEEMYLIEAEAAAHSQGTAVGKSLLETYMNSFRVKEGTEYRSSAGSLTELTDEIFNCKRIELWGEGQILWDYCRLEKAIVRGYEGTNHPEVYRFNSIEGRKAPWANFYIPNSERNRNRGVILNPDPSNAIPRWE